MSFVTSLVKMSAALSRSQLKDLHPRHNAASMVIACLEELLVVIMCVLNSSLGSGQFYSLKEAIVHPRLKISGKDISFSNLRPVSNLQFISKLAKRAVFNQVHEHVMKFQL